jgi:ubiquinone biosynthesis protein Coq4
MLLYQDSQSTMTLREAIDELRSLTGEEAIYPEQLSPEIKKALDAHDAVHVIFGCDTSETDEVIAHAWMLLGTTVKMDELQQIAAHNEHRQIASEVGHLRMLRFAIGALPRLLKAAIAAKQMKKRFPWERYFDFLDRSLLDIREEFGIKITSAIAR